MLKDKRLESQNISIFGSNKDKGPTHHQIVSAISDRGSLIFIETKQTQSNRVRMHFQVKELSRFIYTRTRILTKPRIELTTSERVLSHSKKQVLCVIEFDWLKNVGKYKIDNEKSKKDTQYDDIKKQTKGEIMIYKHCTET